MTETINYVREDQIQDERTTGMLDAVNQNHDRKARAEELAHMAGRARIRELEQQEQRRVAELQRLAWAAFYWAAGCSALVILAHTGAIAGWVMQVGTTALNLVLGYVVGLTTK